MIVRHLSQAPSFAQPRWAERRQALVWALGQRPQTANRRWCPRLDKGVKAGTPGGDLRRLIDEGLARLEHKPPSSGETRLMSNGERTKKPRRMSCPKQVALTAAGRVLLAQLTPSPLRVAQPWAKRRAALVEAGLA